MSSLSDSRIYVAGHRGMVGSAVVRALRACGHERLVTAGRDEVDLREQAAARDFFAREKPEVVVLAAARVGGIHANATLPADFLYDNLMIAANVIDAAWHCGVKRLLFLGSSCIYPREAPQPMPESCLLTGPLEVTNEAYALAKIAGLKLCQHYRHQHGALFHSAMPTNLYGPGDNYHAEHSHVIPGLLRRFHEAKLADAAEVVVWGSGRPLREFLHVDDLAAACLHLLRTESPPDWVNVGSGEECSIADLARTIQEVVGYRGRLRFDVSKPDGTPRKRLDTGLLESLGWRPVIPLAKGLREAYQDFLANGTRRN
jgi:GDP-L-fucose synthase